MSKLAVVVTAVVCIPIGAIIGRPAAAQARVVEPPPLTHFEKSQLAMRDAWLEIQASMNAYEPIWHDDGGHAVAAMNAIDTARRSIDRAESWATDASHPGSHWRISRRP